MRILGLGVRVLGVGGEGFLAGAFSGTTGQRPLQPFLVVSFSDFFAGGAGVGVERFSCGASGVRVLGVGVEIPGGFL